MNTKNEELNALLDRLRAQPAEADWLEFKANRYSAQEIGEYISALANAACLCGKSHGYLVFGINDANHEVEGTAFNPDLEKGNGNQALLLWLSLGLHPNLGFEAYKLSHHGRNVVLFEINAAFDHPVKFYGTAYIRVGTSKTKLSKHPDKERRLWQRRTDWSAQICERATMVDLDQEAIQKAKHEYVVKFPAKADDVAGWDDETFLNKARITMQGGITNSALLLLGSPESSALLSPAVCRISWLLKDGQNHEKDYHHFGAPLLLNVSSLLGKIRNLTFRALPGGTLFPIEIQQYDNWVLREALHNCIAHQDYGLCGRINVVETPDSLLITNVGSFLPGAVETVIQQDAPLEVYRNPFLAEAMINLNMIDTQGGGIKRMFQTQAKRFFPMPDYDFSTPDRVAVRIEGRILNERYSQLLMERADLDLWQVVLLDKVQKGLAISREHANQLRKAGLIEGRYPNLLISAKLAAATGRQAEHIRNRGFDEKYYRDLLLELIRKHGPVAPSTIAELFMKTLPDVLSEKQKLTKIRNLTYDLAHRRHLIKNAGANRGRGSRWVVAESAQTNNEAEKK